MFIKFKKPYIQFEKKRIYLPKYYIDIHDHLYNNDHLYKYNSSTNYHLLNNTKSNIYSIFTFRQQLLSHNNIVDEILNINFHNVSNEIKTYSLLPNYIHNHNRRSIFKQMLECLNELSILETTIRCQFITNINNQLKIKDGKTYTITDLFNIQDETKNIRINNKIIIDILDNMNYLSLEPLCDIYDDIDHELLNKKTHLLTDSEKKQLVKDNLTAKLDNIHLDEIINNEFIKFNQDIHKHLEYHKFFIY